MENVILVVHLILAVCLIGVVLLQRSEGGGLGMGGGGGVVSSRGVATALGKLTWGFAIAFIITSVALTVIAAKNSASGSVIDRIGASPLAAPKTAPAPDKGGDAAVPPASDLLPPTKEGSPLAPPRAN